MKIKNTIVIDNHSMDYSIHYKNIKRVNLRVEAGVILVSCPFHYPIKEIESLIKEYYPKFKERLDNYHPAAIYEDQGYAYFLGNKYTIQLIDMGIKKVVIKKGRIVVYHTSIEKVLKDYFNDYLAQYIDGKIRDYCQKEARFPYPEVCFKRTKRRYGSCYYRLNRVCFNPILIHKPKAFIDYVILHELCHFIEPNHSPAFYQEVEKWMPNYKIIKEEGETNENQFT